MVDGTMDSNKRASGNGFRGSERNLGNDWWTSWNKQGELKESTSAAAGIKIITIIIFFIKTQKVNISIFQEVTTTTTTTKKTSLFIEAVSNHSEAEARQSQVSSCITVINCQMLRKL